MRKIIAFLRVVFSIAAGAVLLASTAMGQQAAPDPQGLTLSSTAFPDGGELPDRYACGSPREWPISPPLQWTHIPQGTAAFVVAFTNPDNHPMMSIAEEFYWMRWNIPATTNTLPEGTPVAVDLPDLQRSLRDRLEGAHVGGRGPACRD